MAYAIGVICTKPARPCRQLNCPNLTNHPSHYCPDHLKQSQQQIDRKRGTAVERGYDYRWSKARTIYLREHPLCVKCLAEGRVVAGTVVDHIIPHRGDYQLMWDTSNWQSLCVFHHARKTATSDGAFGNRETR